MILMDELVSQVLLEEGQYLLPLDTYGFDAFKQERLFISTIKQFEKYAKVKDRVTIQGSKSGTHIPEAATIIQVTPQIDGNFTRSFSETHDELWEFDKNTRLFYSIAEIDYVVEYLKDHVIENLNYSYSPCKAIHNEKYIEFIMPGAHKVGSLKISKNGIELVESLPQEEDASDIELIGALGNGKYDLETNKVTITLNNLDEGDILVEFVSKYKGCYGLEMSNDLFMTWFKANLLNAIGAVKNQTMVDGAGLPFDNSRDTLLDRARQLRDQMEELKNNYVQWWNW